MNRDQIENIYIANGLINFRLKSIEDIAKCHGVNCIELPGFKKLDEINKEAYKIFMVNMYNSWGLMSRTRIRPQKIDLVEKDGVKVLRFIYDYYGNEEWCYIINGGKEWC